MPKTIDEYIAELREYSRRSVVPTVTVPEEPDNQKYARGILKLQVTRSKGTYPISGANYVILDKNRTEIERGTTDNSGQSKLIELPAMPGNLTDSPGTDYKDLVIFYDAEVTADGFITSIVKNIPIFENITTIQNFDLTFLGAAENQAPQITELPTENTL